MAIEIKKVAVIGGGTMGKQIALNAAISGFDTYLVDSFPGVLEKVDVWSKEYLDGRVAKGKMENSKVEEILKRFHLNEKMDEAVADADLVIEAIVERMDVKKELFANLEKMTKPTAILASNSSTFVPSLIAADLKKPERFANLHYFNPALQMELVEVVIGPKSSQETIDALMDFAGKIGKKAIKVQKEIEGFIVNRILGAINNEAWFLLTNGYATAQDIDTASEKGLGHPMGSFRLMDLIGLDVIHDIRTNKWKATGNDADRPPQVLDDLVKNGHLGRKTGKGFYTYN